MRNFCLLLLALLMNATGSTARDLPDKWDSQYQVIKDLNREWITVGENKKYVPYIDKSMADIPVIGVPLALSRYSGNLLLVCIPSNSALLIEKKITSFYEDATCVRLDIDSLRQFYDKESIFITVYQPEKKFEEVGLWVVQPLNSSDIQAANAIQKRDTSALGDFFSVGILLLLIIYAILINQYPKIFSNLYSLSRVFSLRTREDNTRIRLINEAHVVFLIQHCLLLAFLFIILVSTTDLITLDVPYLDFQPESFGGFMLLWGEVALAVFGVIWAKYIIVMLFGSLFRLRQLRFLHMLDYMRMSLVYGALLFTLIILVFAGVGYYQSSYFDILIYLFVGLSALRVIILYFRLFSSASFRNMYLISYLCVAEIIPLLIGLEVLII